LSSISIRRAHTFSPSQARGVADTIAAQLERDYGIEANWQGDTLHFKRAGVNGTLHLASKELILDVRLGFMLMAFRDDIAAAIERNLDQHLSAASVEKRPPRR
jgi:putative polyhydroxyalkanoate system protein